MAQIDALPFPAALAYAEALGVLMLNPWGGEPVNRRNPDGAVRRLLFGAEGAGMLVYLIIEDDRRVDVLQVHWAG